MTPLTEALLEPGLVAVDDRIRRAAHHELERRLASLSTGSAVRCRIASRELARPQAERHRGAFRWTARAAGRAIGLSALASVVGDKSPTASPVAAVRVELRRMQDRARDGGEHSSLVGWIARASPGAAAMVAAEATTWCTRLLCGLDWSRIGPRADIGRDYRWQPSSASFTLTARADVRCRPGDERAGSSLLVVQTGSPEPASRASLGFIGLVSALDPRLPEAPARVVGWWPDCGRWTAVPVDETTLAEAADRVLETATIRGGRQRLGV